jgi:Streptomyces sporulation and cell division protein, SsgA
MTSQCHWGWQEMSINSSTAVSAELGLGLVGPERTIVPLMASLTYSCQDPYAVKIAFHVGTDEPVEWTLARDLLAAALHSREGIGDVQAWPSAASDEGLTGMGQRVLNISMTSPFGHAQFESSAAAVEAFLAQTYQIVPEGHECDYMDFDAELTELLSQA